MSGSLRTSSSHRPLINITRKLYDRSSDCEESSPKNRKGRNTSGIPSLLFVNQKYYETAEVRK